MYFFTLLLDSCSLSSSTFLISGGASFSKEVTAFLPRVSVTIPFLANQFFSCKTLLGFSKAVQFFISAESSAYGNFLAFDTAYTLLFKIEPTAADIDTILWFTQTVLEYNSRVADVSSGSMQSVRGLLSKASLQKPVTVDLSDGVAVVQVHVIAKYGSKIMPVCAKVQENVKQTIQNMTGITVSRVDVIVAGLEEPAADQHK